MIIFENWHWPQFVQAGILTLASLLNLLVLTSKKHRGKRHYLGLLFVIFNFLLLGFGGFWK